ncbi:hypothetical protein ABZ752_22640 [Streptomyces roseifaciens]
MTAMTTAAPTGAAPRPDASTDVTLPTPIVGWLAVRAAEEQHPTRGEWAAAHRRAGDEVSRHEATLAALDWAALHMDSLTWEFIENRTGAADYHGFVIYDVDAARTEIHFARLELLETV